MLYNYHIIVIGAGSAGLVVASGAAGLGAKVALIESDKMGGDCLRDRLLVSLGRRPATSGLGLEKTGILTVPLGFIVTDTKLRTNIKNIYACGDVTGPFQFTHMAGYQASIVIRNIIFGLGAKVNYTAVPWTTYTRPEVAHVGYTEPLAKKLGLFKESIMVNLSENDSSKAEDDTLGFLKLNLNNKGLILGATLVGDKAGEMIPIITLAIKQKLKASVFLSMIFSYPTEAEIYMSASLTKVRSSFKNWQKKLIQRLFLR